MKLPGKNLQNEQVRFRLYLGIIVFLGCACIAAGLAFLASSKNPVLEESADVLRGVGEALLIAAILAFAVDANVKARLVSEVARNVLEFAVGWALPPEMEAALKSLIQQTHVRRDFLMTVRLEPMTDHPGFVRAHFTTTYRVDNLTSDPRPYRFRSVIEKSNFPKTGENKIVRVELQSAGAYSFELTGAELDKEVKETSVDDKSSIEFGREIMLPVASKGLLFYTERYAVYPDTYGHVLDFIEPVIGVTISFANDDRFERDVYFSTPGPVQHMPIVHPLTWQHPGLFIRGQHARIRWIKT